MTAGPPARTGRSCQRGFTLLELLIAMTLLGLIFAALTGGLRFGTQAWRAGAERLADGEDLQLLHRTMRRQLASVVKGQGTPGGTRREGSFEGDRDSMSFVATAPARAMTPGLYRISLGLVPDSGAYALALRWQAIGQAPGASEFEGSEPLVRGARSVEFGYFGDPEGGASPRWLERWPEDAVALPRLARIVVNRLEDARAHWPAMILTVAGGSG